MPGEEGGKQGLSTKFPGKLQGLVMSKAGLVAAANWLLGPLSFKKQIHGMDCNGNGHVTGTSGWLPPHSSWDGGGIAPGLPFGWEAATDKDGRLYYVNHINKTSTYEDPRKWGATETEEIPEPRDVTLERHPELGFGFVAGSEKPVIVRFVTGGGPSVDRLMPGDQILSINGEDVARAPRDHVIQLVRNCRESVSLVVCQPPLDNSSSRKSALLSAAKKAKLKCNPSRVRFAESVDINGSPLNPSVPGSDSVVPLMPNVLKVFLENGQTKSFKYDSSTTVQDVLDSLQAKLGLKAMSHFSLVVEHVKSLKRNKLTLLNPSDTLAKIASRPGAHNLRCLFRVTFVPTDAYELLRTDSVAFEYLYVQCCNDVVQERFAPELKYEVALRLAALHIHQHAVSNGLNSGNKELRKLLTHFLKLNSNLVSPGQKFLTGLQAKLHYLKIISELPSYGAKCFSTNMSDSTVETVILISPKFGVSQISSLRNTVPQNLCDIQNLSKISVSRDDEVHRKVEITLKDPDKEPLVLTLEDRDAEEFVLVLQGYFSLLAEKDLPVTFIKSSLDETPPPYCGPHSVTSQGWNYPGGERDQPANIHTVDLSAHPPYHLPPENFKIPNGHIGSDSGSDGDASMTSATDINMMDSNRNITVEDNANLNRVQSVQYSTFGPRYNGNSNNNSRGFPTSILKKAGANSPPTLGVNEDDNEGYEARNDEVIRRVVEMKQILQTAENYLSEVEGEVTDVESVVTEKSNTESELSSNYGKLKHSDSLLLLTQVKDEEEEEEEEEGGKVTVQPSTPQNSPARGQVSVSSGAKSYMKHSDSSFGLHSPDSFNDDVQMLIRKFKENPGLKTNLSESKVVLDPDLIDLTMIPPPMTPDEDGVFRLFPGAVSTPPTPFADRQSLEAELKALEKDIGYLERFRRQRSEETYYGPIRSSLATSSEPDTLNSDGEETSLNSLTLPDLVTEDERPSLAAARHLRDIDMFIENMTVPPPPSGHRQQHKQYSAAPVVELTSEDISAFIIPPPPDQQDHRSSSGPVKHHAKIDREVLELKLPKDQFLKTNNDKISPKIATLQERISQFQDVNGKGKELALTLHKDKFGYPLQNSKQEQTGPKENEPSNVLRGGVQSKKEIFMKQGQGSSESSQPPPPPPRSAVPKQGAANYNSQTLGRKPAVPSYQFGSNLTRSNSQDDLTTNQSKPGASHKIPIKATAGPKVNGKLSSSSEDLGLKRSPISPSKLSVTSSSDSISSTASVNTVKSASPTEDNPPLPPRLSPTKVNIKPPIPPLASPEKSELQHKLVSNSPFRNGQIGGNKTPSPTSPTNIPASPKPVLPSRLSKPGSPSKSSPGRSLPQIPSSSRPSPAGKVCKPAAPTPPGSPQVGRSQSATERLTGGRRLPVPPPSQPSHSPLRAKPEMSSPKSILKNNGHVNGHRITNGHHEDVYTNSQFEHDESLETCVDEPDLDNDALKQAGRLIVFKKAEEVVAQVVVNIRESRALCTNGDISQRNDAKFGRAKELLTTESRQFVTASKLFVKSATESEGQLMECLNHCVHMIDRIGNITRDVALSSTTPGQTQNLISKVQDVADTYLQTLQAASQAIGKDMNDPSMNVLMKRATSLAGVLTTLMRSLRVFN